MSGRPIEAVKLGALKIAEQLYGNVQNPFEKFITLTYDSKIETFDGNNIDSFKSFISSVGARGSTDFRKVFEWISNFIKTQKDLKEIVVIFFTDGEDTCNDKNLLENSLSSLKK